jgi:hypothetical protein
MLETSAISKLFQARPALLEKRIIKRPAPAPSAAAAAVAVSRRQQQQQHLFT